MDKETYEALKEIVKFVRGKSKIVKNNDIVAIEDWIDEVAKEYDHEFENNVCKICGFPKA